MFVVWLAKILAALNANVRPGEVGAAIAYAFLVASIPGLNLLGLGLLFLSFFLKINNAMFFVFLAIFSPVVRLWDPLVDALGFAFLTWPAAGGFFTFLANVPLVPWTNFNHSLVLGGFVLGLLLFIPLALVAAHLVRVWRNEGRERLLKSKPIQAFLKWPLVSKLAVILGKIWTASQELV